MLNIYSNSFKITWYLVIKFLLLFSTWLISKCTLKNNKILKMFYMLITKQYRYKPYIFNMNIFVYIKSMSL